MGAGQRETGMKPGVDAVDGFSSETLSHSPRERSEGMDRGAGRNHDKAESDGRAESLSLSAETEALSSRERCAAGEVEGESSSVHLAMAGAEETCQEVARRLPSIATRQRQDEPSAQRSLGDLQQGVTSIRQEVEGNGWGGGGVPPLVTPVRGVPLQGLLERGFG